MARMSEDLGTSGMSISELMGRVKALAPEGVAELMKINADVNKEFEDIKAVRKTKDRRGILGSKVGAGTKVLASGRGGFREWSTKLKNAYGRARPGAKPVFDQLGVMATTWVRGGVEEGSLKEYAETIRQELAWEEAPLRTSMRT